MAGHRVGRRANVWSQTHWRKSVVARWHASPFPAEQTAAADALQRPLRFRFQARLSAGVGHPGRRRKTQKHLPRPGGSPLPGRASRQDREHHLTRDNALPGRTGSLQRGRLSLTARAGTARCATRPGQRDGWDRPPAPRQGWGCAVGAQKHGARVASLCRRGGRHPLRGSRGPASGGGRAHLRVLQAFCPSAPPRPRMLLDAVYRGVHGLVVQARRVPLCPDAPGTVGGCTQTAASGRGPPGGGPPTTCPGPAAAACPAQPAPQPTAHPRHGRRGRGAEPRPPPRRGACVPGPAPPQRPHGRCHTARGLRAHRMATEPLWPVCQERGLDLPPGARHIPHVRCRPRPRVQRREEPPPARRGPGGRRPRAPGLRRVAAGAALPRCRRQRQAGARGPGLGCQGTGSGGDPHHHVRVLPGQPRPHSGGRRPPSQPRSRRRPATETGRGAPRRGGRSRALARRPALQIVGQRPPPVVPVPPGCRRPLASTSRGRPPAPGRPGGAATSALSSPSSQGILVRGRLRHTAAATAARSTPTAQAPSRRVERGRKRRRPGVPGAGRAVWRDPARAARL